MKHIVKQILLSIFFVMFFFCFSYSQQKLGGEYDVTLKKIYYPEFKDSINWLYVAEPDSIPYVPDRGVAEVAGFGIPINKNFFELATRQETADGEYIFLLRVTQEKAVHTSFFFNEFYLPEGPEITFLDTNGVYLADYYPYDFDFNPEEPEEGRLLNGIPPDAIIKFTCKKDKLQRCILLLEQLFYVYKDYFSESEPKPKDYVSKQSNLQIKSSQNCDFSVSCFYDYTDWFNEINRLLPRKVI